MRAPLFIQGTRVYSSRKDLFGHVTSNDGGGRLYVKWEPPYDQELPPELVDIIAGRIALAGEYDPRLDQTVAEPIEAPITEIEDWQKRAIEADPFPAKQLLDDNGYVVHEQYDHAAENDLGAALTSLINHCLKSDDRFARANAEHVKKLMDMAIAATVQQ